MTSPISIIFSFDGFPNQRISPWVGIKSYLYLKVISDQLESLDVSFHVPKYNIFIIFNNVGCVFLMVLVSILPQAEFGPNDHREGAPHFMNCSFKKDIQIHFFIIVSRLRNRMRHEFLTYYNGVE